jgi:hypothetical protein
MSPHAIHLIGLFILGMMFGGSLIGLLGGLWLSHLRIRYTHLDHAFEVVEKMRSRGL